MIIRFFVRLLTAYITIQIKLAIFLLKHFEITNSLLAGFTTDMLLVRFNLNIWIRIGLVVVIAAASFILQYLFIPVRIAFGFFSSFMCGTIAYALFKDIRVFSPFIPTIVTAILVLLLNWFGWKKRMETSE